MQDLNLISSLGEYNPLLGKSSETATNDTNKHSSDDSNSSSGSSDTLVDAASMTSSIASSCATYISQGGDAYKCAKSEFSYRRKKPKMINQQVSSNELVPFKRR